MRFIKRVKCEVVSVGDRGGGFWAMGEVEVQNFSFISCQYVSSSVKFVCAKMGWFSG